MICEGNCKLEIFDICLVVKSCLFGIEEMYLCFSNGVECIYECLCILLIVGVMCVLMFDCDIVVLICEYGVGVDEYQIILFKGVYEYGEDWCDVVNCEFKEEVGYGVCKLILFKCMILLLGYMGYYIIVVLVEDFYEECLFGDELEFLEVIFWKLLWLDELLQCEDVIEVCVIVVLLMI